MHGARCAGRLGRGWDRRLARPPPGACDLTSLTGRVLFSGVGSYPATCCCCRRCCCCDCCGCCYYYEYDYYEYYYDDDQPRLLPLLHERAYHLVRVGAQGGHHLG